MKKTRAILILPLLASGAFLSSCSFNSKINLIYGSLINDNLMTDIKYLDLQSKIENEETFLLAIEPTGACSCWSDFKTIIQEYYIPVTHAIVYHMKYDMFYEQNRYGLNLRDGYTTFAIFQDGKLAQNIISDNQNMFHDANAFMNYMHDVTMPPQYFYIDLDVLSVLYGTTAESFFGEDKFVVYFARNNCGDCQYADKYFLKQYAQRRPVRKAMYILDCEALGIRKYDEKGDLTPESQKAWNEFKVEYGLADQLNLDYGYNTGYVPTFQVIAPKEDNPWISASVYFNDSIEEKDGKYYVSDSFYTEERLPKLEYLKDYNGVKVLKGLEVAPENITKYGSYLAWNQEAAAKYHSPLLKEFLNYYL